MALKSKNFIFKRLTSDGTTYAEYAESSSWSSSSDDDTFQWNEVTEALPAAGYWGSTNGMHTLAFVIRNFSGRIYLQATLASEPTDDDWFYIKFTETGAEYIQFLDSRISSTTSDISTTTTYGTTGTFSNTVVGNFTYLRVGITRDFIATTPTDQEKQYSGKIEEVLINF